MNLLRDPIFTLRSRPGASLPDVFAALAAGALPAHPALRPHQRPAWHMFLVQLAALALWRAGLAEPPVDAVAWRSALRLLTGSHRDDGPWRLAVPDRSSPAFLQPPDPGGLVWKPVPTPDAADMLITARNHDLKREVARRAAPEDWVFALVSLQTMEGYGGPRKYGIARMNGGASNRTMVGLAPLTAGSAVDASAHWRRDVRRLLAHRAAGDEKPPCTPGGHGLLWLLPWRERERLDLPRLDPWFIEVCRRVRLVDDGGSLRAERADSAAPRTNAKPYRGAVGDPWAPVHATEGKSLTATVRGFDYRLLCDLLYSGDWAMPDLAVAGGDETGDMLLLTEAIARGKNRTDGFKSRAVPVPGRVVPFLTSGTLGTIAGDQMREISGFDTALRNALALMAADGDRDAVDKTHYRLTRAPRATFDRLADGLFFPGLWHRAEAAAAGDSKLPAKKAFLRRLEASAGAVLDAALPTMPCRHLFRDRAEVRARRAYRRTLRTDEACRDLFLEEPC